jgi:hypothetical protein
MAGDQNKIEIAKNQKMKKNPRFFLLYIEEDMRVL